MIPWNKKTDQQFKLELGEKRPDLKTEDTYINNKFPMLFVCTSGHSFKAAPNHVLNDKSNCKVCANLKQSAERTRTQQEFIETLKSINSPFKVVGKYINAQTGVDVVCQKGHTSKVMPYNATRGSTCRQCVDYGKFRDAPVTLYYVRILHDSKTYYKVGLTQRGVSRRFVGAEGSKITSLYEEEYDSPLFAWEAEQSLIKAFKEFITKDKVLRKGNTEVFCCDVLHMDNTQESLWL